MPGSKVLKRNPTVIFNDPDYKFVIMFTLTCKLLQCYNVSGVDKQIWGTKTINNTFRDMFECKKYIHENIA